jgi:hypothetical protein
MTKKTLELKKTYLPDTFKFQPVSGGRVAPNAPGGAYRDHNFQES